MSYPTHPGDVSRSVPLAELAQRYSAMCWRWSSTATGWWP